MPNMEVWSLKTMSTCGISFSETSEGNIHRRFGISKVSSPHADPSRFIQDCQQEFCRNGIPMSQELLRARKQLQGTALQWWTQYG
ncbi:hypothetical protein PR048_013825 [Dryococelus australis]|uniref:Uncharacterized protein n=1 Tax=Dryococelus australis TaxID=614101 RepID=A0ABQ9HT99_9NEOP|nr:hypothetical protein PR048_013825 [Dryococelus australis]